MSHEKVKACEGCTGVVLARLLGVLNVFSQLLGLAPLVLLRAGDFV